MNEPNLGLDREIPCKRIGVAIVEWDDAVLVGIRQPGQVLAGLHEFPGGKCESDEDTAACAVRECLEETGQRVIVIEKIHGTVHDYPHGRVEIDFFRCRHHDAGPNPLLGNFCWIPRAELGKLDFPEANQPVVTLLISGPRN